MDPSYDPISTQKSFLKQISQIKENDINLDDQLISLLSNYISSGANINTQDFTHPLRGHTFLYFACAYGRPTLVKWLIENGADPFIFINSHSLLVPALGVYHQATVDVLNETIQQSHMAAKYTQHSPNQSQEAYNDSYMLFPVQFHLGHADVVNLLLDHGTTLPYPSVYLSQFQFRLGEQPASFPIGEFWDNLLQRLRVNSSSLVATPPSSSPQHPASTANRCITDTKIIQMNMEFLLPTRNDPLHDTHIAIHRQFMDWFQFHIPSPSSSSSSSTHHSNRLSEAQFALGFFITYTRIFNQLTETLVHTYRVGGKSYGTTRATVSRGAEPLKSREEFVSALKEDYTFMNIPQIDTIVPQVDDDDSDTSSTREAVLEYFGKLDDDLLTHLSSFNPDVIAVTPPMLNQEANYTTDTTDGTDTILVHRWVHGLDYRNSESVSKKCTTIYGILAYLLHLRIHFHAIDIHVTKSGGDPTFVRWCSLHNIILACIQTRLHLSTKGHPFLYGELPLLQLLAKCLGDLPMLYSTRVFATIIHNAWGHVVHGLFIHQLPCNDQYSADIRLLIDTLIDVKAIRLQNLFPLSFPFERVSSLLYNRFFSALSEPLSLVDLSNWMQRKRKLDEGGLDFGDGFDIVTVYLHQSRWFIPSSHEHQKDILYDNGYPLTVQYQSDCVLVFKHLVLAYIRSMKLHGKVKDIHHAIHRWLSIIVQFALPHTMAYHLSAIRFLLTQVEHGTMPIQCFYYIFTASDLTTNENPPICNVYTRELIQLILQSIDPSSSHGKISKTMENLHTISIANFLLSYGVSPISMEVVHDLLAAGVLPAILRVRTEDLLVLYKSTTQHYDHDICPVEICAPRNRSIQDYVNEAILFTHHVFVEKTHENPAMRDRYEQSFVNMIRFYYQKFLLLGLETSTDEKSPLSPSDVRKFSEQLFLRVWASQSPTALHAFVSHPHRKVQEAFGCLSLVEDGEDQPPVEALYTLSQYSSIAQVPLSQLPWSVIDASRNRFRFFSDYYDGTKGLLWYLANRVFAPSIDDITTLFFLEVSSNTPDASITSDNSSSMTIDNGEDTTYFDASHDESDAIFNIDDIHESSSSFPFAFFPHANNHMSFLMIAILRRWSETALTYLVNNMSRDDIIAATDVKSHTVLDYITFCRTAAYAPTVATMIEAMFSSDDSS